MRAINKPSSVRFHDDDYLSRQKIASLLKRLNPEGQRATSFLPYSVLLQMGFTKPNGLPPAGALLPHLSTLTVIHGGFLFYGTVPRVAPAGCYPASRPAKLGLSSRLSARNHLSCSRVTVYHPVYLISTFIHNEIYLLP